MASNDNLRTTTEQEKFLGSAMFRFKAFHRDWLVNVRAEGGVAEQDIVPILYHLRMAEDAAKVVIDGRLAALKEVA